MNISATANAIQNILLSLGAIFLQHLVCQQHMQNSSGTALNLFVNDTEEKQLHWVSMKGDFAYQREKNKRGKSFCSTYYTWEWIREAEVCIKTVQSFH